MNLLERLDELKKLTGDNNNTLSKKTGIPYTTIDGLYKKGYENIKLSTLKTLCEYFDVSIDYMVYGTGTPDEKLLVTLYDSLTGDGQRFLKAQAEFMASVPAFVKNTNQADLFLQQIDKQK